jgi:hypothetical protein
MSALRVVVSFVICALVLGACSSGSNDAGGRQAAATSSTVLVPGTAKIVSFDVPASASCGASDTNTTFQVSWNVTGAKKSVIQVDAAPVPGTSDLSGTAQATVHCDPLPHDVVLIATDANGHLTTDRKIIETSGGAGS